MREDYKTPGVFAIQFVTDVPGGLDFNVSEAKSLDDAFGMARDAIATHPDFKWDGLLIWKDRSAEDLKNLNDQMQDEIGET